MAAGLWIAITAYTVFRHHTDRKARERPVTGDKRQTVTISDPLLHDADLVWSFDSRAERKAFTLGVEAGRDSTITAMNLRKRIPPGDSGPGFHRGEEQAERRRKP